METSKVLKEKLFMKRKNAVLRMSEAEIAECDSFCESYKDFMDIAKIFSPREFPYRHYSTEDYSQPHSCSISSDTSN